MKTTNILLSSTLLASLSIANIHANATSKTLTWEILRQECREMILENGIEGSDEEFNNYVESCVQEEAYRINDASEAIDDETENEIFDYNE